jgi:hypothetical protein
MGRDTLRIEISHLEALDCFDDGLDSLRIEERPSYSRPHRFRRAAAPICDDRAAAGHCLDQHDAEIFLSREDQRLTSGIIVAEIIKRTWP